MKDNVIKLNEKKNEDAPLKRLIGVDQPFDYEEVVALTGSDYIQKLNYDGVICIPYEELRRNSTDADGSEKECHRLIMELFDVVYEYA